ncbi:FecR domain-containing protein [Sphingobacterium tabacisoli]|uniref:FecR domain-containing protein n=1 Tax=Sphingobacterium tabacisoli TaxID=2044855 RepID=A0ABW5L4E8_9SPHI|nr:FecR domain-containing protein [Sphingobacterium tabacisoli]
MNKEIYTLFLKYLNGEHTAAELDVLLAYFEQEEKDPDLDRLILEEVQADVSPDPDSGVESLADEIGQRLFDKIQRSSRVKSLGLWRQVAAAVLVVGLLTVGLFYYRSDNKASQDIASSTQYGTDILPGGTQATLIIDDGSEIPLEDKQDGIAISETVHYSDGTALAVKPTTYATLKTPRGGQYQVTLGDGTVVWLNAASSLRYPIAFNGQQRDVELQGEAYFEVSHQPDKPFVVHSRGQRVKVLGTKFNISDYTGVASSITTLLEGKVEIEHATTQQKQVLVPGKQAVVSKETIRVQTVSDVSDFAAWKDGYFIRTSTTLAEILPELERWYDVTFEIKEQPTTRAYIALNRDAKLSTVLDALTLNYGISFKIEGRRVVAMK